MQLCRHCIVGLALLSSHIMEASPLTLFVSEEREIPGEAQIPTSYDLATRWAESSQDARAISQQEPEAEQLF